MRAKQAHYSLLVLALPLLRTRAMIAERNSEVNTSGMDNDAYCEQTCAKGTRRLLAGRNPNYQGGIGFTRSNNFVVAREQLPERDLAFGRFK